jgi:tetratricopeptide (TPR) repeat protein
MRTAALESAPPLIKPEPEVVKKKKVAALLGILLLVLTLAGAGTFFFLRHRSAPPVAPVAEGGKTTQPASTGPEVTAETPPVTSVPAETQVVQEKTAPAEGKGKLEKETGASAPKQPPKEGTEQKAKETLQAAQEQAKKQKQQKEIDRMLKQAGAFLGLKEYVKAQDTSLKILERDPDNVKAKEIYAQAKEMKQRMRADGKIAQAQAHFVEKKYRLAAEETMAVLKMYPKDPRALELKGKLEELARIEMALQQAEAALESKRFTRAKVIAQQVLDADPENKRAKRVIEMADEGQENKMLQDMVKGLLPSGGGGEMPSIPQELQDQSGGAQIPSLPLPGLPRQ